MVIEYGFYLLTCQDKRLPMKMNVIVHFELLTSFQIFKFNCALYEAVRITLIDYFHFGNTILLKILVTPVSNSSREL